MVTRTAAGRSRLTVRQPRAPLVAVRHKIRSSHTMRPLGRVIAAPYCLIAGGRGDRACASSVPPFPQCTESAYSPICPTLPRGAICACPCFPGGTRPRAQHIGGPPRAKAATILAGNSIRPVPIICRSPTRPLACPDRPIACGRNTLRQNLSPPNCSLQRFVLAPAQPADFRDP
jgi:hypothetical protein